MSIVRQCVAQASILLLIAGGAAAQDTCTYKGADKGAWNNAANWTCGVVPANGNGFTYNAIIPVNLTVNFDLPGYTEITGFNLSSGATLNLSGQQLNVLGVAVQAGLISATGDGTQYLATSQFSVFQDNARAFAKNGAEVSIAARKCAWTNPWGSTDLFRADGPGSLLNLSSLSTFTASTGKGYGSYYYTVAAAGGGVVDLSGLTSVTGATDDDWLRFYVDAGSELNLNKLTKSTGRVYIDPEAPNFSLPALQSASTAWVQVSNSNTIDLPALTSLVNSTLDIQDGGTIQSPALTDFRNSTVTLNQSRFLIAPPFEQMDNARIYVNGGGFFATAIPSYAWTNPWGSTDLFRADGPGSLLDLSSLSTFTASTGKGYGSYYYTVAAAGGGVVDLSGLTSVTGATDDDWLRFYVDAGSELNLNKLTKSTGRVYFDPEAPNFSLPALQSADSAYVQVSIFNAIDLPALTSVSGSVLDIQDGGTIKAPKLTNFRNSSITLNQARFLIAPPFEQIDNARIAMNGGASFAVAAPSYAWTNPWGSTDLFRADGPGSLLDLSSLSTFTASTGKGYGSYYYTVAATGGGVVDLSALTSVVGATDDEWLSFDALSGGSLLFGSVQLKSGRTRSRADTIDSSIVVAGDLIVNGTGLVSLTLVASMILGGDFAFSATDETWINLADGKLVANGSAPQTIEVGGKDLGLPIGSIPANFQMGQLTVGSFDQKSRVILADTINNGNRGPNGEPELLYLQGFPADDGLRILNGSDLVLNGIQAYAVIANQWVHLNELIPDGQTSVAFDQGRIWLTDPGDCVPDIDGNGTLDIFDFLGFVNLFNAGDPAADCDGDEELGLFDFLCFVNGFNTGC